MEIGNKIMELRKKNGMSQEELANKVGIDQSDLSKIEKGLANPSVKTINRIAKGLGIKTEISFQWFSINPLNEGAKHSPLF